MPTLIVFLAVLLAYTSLGLLLFGEELDAFKTMARSFQSCLLIMLGDWDVAEIYDVHPAGRSLSYCITSHTPKRA